MASNDVAPQQSSFKPFLTALAVLVVILGILFHQSFEKNETHFANDAPLGQLIEQKDARNGLTGHWDTKTWVGMEALPSQPTADWLFLVLFDRIAFLKFMPPFSLLLAGIAAWIFFRQLKFAPAVCILAAVAAMLNMNFFSNACWGQHSRPFSLAATFLALAALQSGMSGHRWLKTILAGFAVGVAVMQGFDVGALFSLGISAFAFFLELSQPAPTGGKVARSFVRVGIMAICAAFIAAYVLVALVSTQIKGVVGQAQDAETRKMRWTEATLWSLPKSETLRLVIPGLYGYRMDSQGGAQYWGRLGQQPGNPATRFNGNGEHAGIVVVVIAAFALAQSFRKQKLTLEPSERKAIWFWGGFALVCLLLAWGKYAPFYQFFYAIPYASTIRNPAKFLHLFHLAVIILFGYGLQSLYRFYIQPASLPSGGQLGKWWSSAPAFEKKWTIATAVTLVVSFLGYLLYSSSRKDLAKHLETCGYGGPLADMTAKFSFHEAFLFVVFLTLSAAVVTMIFSGWFAGQRAKWATIAIGLLLFIDLGRSNGFWIKYWNYKYKYEENPIVQILKEKPYERRVTMLPIDIPQTPIGELRQLHNIEWHQHHFPYYKIQSLAFIQNPRMSVEDSEFQQKFQTSMPGLLREWELTNTRFVIGLAGGLADMLNQQVDPVKKRFKLHTAFEMAMKPGAPRDQQYGELQDRTVVLNPQGRFGLIEFTGALPRVKLYSNWQVLSNNTAVLEQLAKPEFEPQQTVIVTADAPLPASSGAVDQTIGTAEITSYESKKVEISADAKAATVLLFNDKFNPHWKVTVDGQAASVLRCNSIMRGVFLQPGSHKIVFTFDPPHSALYITLAGFGVALALLGVVLVKK